MFDPKKIKQDFPIFRSHPDLVYLDSASTSQKPQAVIDTVTEFYTHKNANVHRGIYKLAEAATEAYEGARKKVAQFIEAKENEIVFTGNTNEAINLVAYGWARKNLQRGDIIVLSEMEHHANIVPWIRLKEEIGVELHYLPFRTRMDSRLHGNDNSEEDFRLNYKSIFESSLDIKKIKLVALTHASNVLGTINPIREIIRFYKEKGLRAKYLVDAAQSVPHFQVNVKDLDCDFLAFSGHKMLGPSGVGVLWAKQALLEEMEPLLVGSHMISRASQEKAEWTEIPWKFEVGTGKLEAIVGLGAAVDYLRQIGMDTIFEHDIEIGQYALKKLEELEFIDLYGPCFMNSSKNDSDQARMTETKRLAIFSFNVKSVHAHDVAQILDRFHIAVRSGHHCAEPLMDRLNIPATARASFYIYNDESDVDKLVEGLKEVKKILKL